MPTPSSCSPTFVDIDLGALAHNLRQARQRLQSSCDILAIVKANAYGHGAFETTRALRRLGVRRFGVATVEEGTDLRRAGIVDQIVVLGAVLPAQLPDLLAHSLTPVMYDLPLLEELVRVVPPSAKPYPVHLKIDTGMGRLGFAPDHVTGRETWGSADPSMLVGDATRLTEATGWRPEIPFEQTIDDLLEYWRQMES